MKRRNFLKLIPVGLIASKFGGVIGMIPVEIKSIPFFTEIKPSNSISGQIISITINNVSYPVSNVELDKNEAIKCENIVYV